jgi:hypothetical protein
MGQRRAPNTAPSLGMTRNGLPERPSERFLSAVFFIGKGDMMKRLPPPGAANGGRSVFDRLKTIPFSDPELTPENWCQVQPCAKVRIASRELILTQPSSTVLVYALGILTTAAGLYFLMIRGGETSRLWWGISLVLWGLGALLAGTSYQAFGYHIKCAGRQTCAWSSWWEVVYLIFQQLSMDAMLVAVAFSCTGGAVRTGLLVFAAATAAGYVVMALLGGLIPIKSLITFNGMVWVSTPIVLIFLGLNGWRYHQLHLPMDLALLGTWALLLLISAVYWLYDELDITNRLWAGGRGIWFSQNDVLHIGLILWVMTILAVVAHRIQDHVGPGLSG